MSAVFRSHIEDASQNGISLVGENLVGNALLNVRCFAGKDQQRFILCLPAEAGNGPVVATGIEATRNAKGCFGSRICSKIALQHAIRRVFYKTQAKGWGWYAQDHVVVGNLKWKVRLSKRATRGIHPAFDGVKVMNPSIQSARGIQNESRFNHRPTRRDKRRDSIGCSIQRRQGNLRVWYWVSWTVKARAASPYRRLSMALSATIAIESRSQADARFSSDRAAH